MVEGEGGFGELVWELGGGMDVVEKVEDLVECLKILIIV